MGNRPGPNERFGAVEPVKEATLLLDLAISRWRASSSADKGRRQLFLRTLEEARREIVRLREQHSPSLELIPGEGKVVHGSKGSGQTRDPRG